MSDRSDQKMRDLMRRVGDMAPSPPDFPEDVPTLQPVRRRSGAWVYAAGAAAAAGLLAVPFLLWMGSLNGPVATSPDFTVPTTVPTSSPTVTAPVPGPSVGWPVFLVQTPSGSPTGNPALVSFLLNLAPGSDPALVSGMNAPEDILFALDRIPVVLPPGFTSAVPEGVRIVGKRFEVNSEGTTRVVLDMNPAFLAGNGGLLADFTMLNQIIFTASQFEVGEVLFTVEGQPVEAFGSEGLSLVDPVNAQTFIEYLNPIIISDPVYIDSDGILTVRGWANVFEAAISWQVYVGPAALPAHSGNVTATCGTGCWGSFEILEDLGGREGDWSSHELWVYTDSALDGSPTMVVSLPFTAIRVLTD